jgi:hypothetical protein
MKQNEEKKWDRKGGKEGRFVSNVKSNCAIQKHISLNRSNDMDDYEMDLVLAIAMNVSSCVQTWIMNHIDSINGNYAEIISHERRID